MVYGVAASIPDAGRDFEALALAYEKPHLLPDHLAEMLADRS